MKQYTYLAIDLGCILFPLLASFHPKLPFYKHWRSFCIANIAVALLFLVWDEWFTQLGVWGFNPDYTTGIYIGNLPLEEVLFFICIPYACVFSYFAIHSHLKFPPKTNKWQRAISFVLMITLLFIGIFNFDKLYTSITFVLTAAFLAFSLYKKLDLTYIYVSYIFIFPFFLCSNGLLTGSYLSSPIVWYNNAENLNIRIFTIPIEDTMYGFLLIVLNIILTFKLHFRTS